MSLDYITLYSSLWFHLWILLSPEPDTPCHLLLAEGAQHRQPRGLLEVGAGIPEE